MQDEDDDDAEESVSLDDDEAWDTQMPGSRPALPPLATKCCNLGEMLIFFWLSSISISCTLFVKLFDAGVIGFYKAAFGFWMGIACSIWGMIRLMMKDRLRSPPMPLKKSPLPAVLEVKRLLAEGASREKK